MGGAARTGSSRRTRDCRRVGGELGEEEESVVKTVFSLKAGNVSQNIAAGDTFSLHPGDTGFASHYYTKHSSDWFTLTFV